VSASIDEHRSGFGVEPICRSLGASASAYYDRAMGRRPTRQIDAERLLGVIRELHAKNHFAHA
jgi:putative transposase